jgi:hypothetical protein
MANKIPSATKYSFVVNRSNVHSEMCRLRSVGAAIRTGASDFAAAWDLMLTAVDVMIRAGWRNSQGLGIKRFEFEITLRPGTELWKIDATMMPVLL